MKKILLLICLFNISTGYAQTLPIDFESTIVTADFVDFDGGTASVIANPNPNGINSSATVAQIVRDGGDIWAGSKLVLANNLDFSTMAVLSMKVFTTAPVGTTVKFKLEGMGETELDVVTTVSNAWETLTWDFTGQPNNFDNLVFMFDFGNVGDGSATSTFLFDDIEQLEGLAQIDLPVTFEDETVNPTVIDFGGNVSSLVTDPTDANNTVIQSIKTSEAATWAGTTIGTAAGFKTFIPLTLSDSKMTVRVWSPDAGTPIRLKVEDANDVTHTCETETNTTVAGAWETLEFDFANEAPNTALLSVGLGMGWQYNKASIFFNFGTEGSEVGEKTYYFDDVTFGEPLSVGLNDNPSTKLTVYPNPSKENWTFVSDNGAIRSLVIFDVLGRAVLSLSPNVDRVVVPVFDFDKGVYFCKVEGDFGVEVVGVVRY